MLKAHVYVGAVDSRRHLIQHQTQLYLTDTHALCTALHTQEAVRRFGQVMRA